MKKIFMQLWQWILKYRKRLIYGALAFFVGQVCFFNLWWIWLVDDVYAADSNTPSQSDTFQEKAINWYEKLSFIQKTIYVVLYPLLVVAWKLADNSFVYWEVFGFDAVLWQLWNIVKNFANFGLWFLLVYKIFEFLLKWQKPWEMKKLLISWLIACVWIQASWFFMYVLVDVSTILAYWVWWLPISILKENTWDTTDENLKYNPYLLKSVVYLDVKDLDTFHTYFTNVDTWWHYGDVYISECKRFSFVDKTTWKSEELLLAPNMIYYADEQGNIHKTEQLLCHAFWQVYYFKSLHGLIQFRSCSDIKSCKTQQDLYNEDLTKAINDITAKDRSNAVWLVSSVQLNEIWDAHIEWWAWVQWDLRSRQYGDGEWVDLYNKWTWTKWKTSRLQDVLEWNSYVWVFTVLYSSLLASVWVIPSDAGTFAALLNVALSVWHMLAIAIPLIAVAIVFMMRVWVMWVAIAIAPFIILLTAFGLNKKVFTGKFLEYFDVKNLIPIIFSPAIICFAVSISTILVTIISGLNVEWIKPVKTEILWWLIKLDIGWLSLGIWKLIISVFWIAITWFLLWAAIEASKLWKSGVIQSMKGLVGSALWSIPIVPVIWKWENGELTTKFVWAKTAFGGGWILSKVMDRQMDEYRKTDNEFINDFINPDNAKWRTADAYKTEIVGITPTWDWTKQKISITWSDGSKVDYTFDSVLPSKKTEIIEAINAISDEGKRKVFWQSKQEITFNDGEKNVTYKFNGWNDKDWKPINKYELVK